MPLDKARVQDKIRTRKSKRKCRNWEPNVKAGLSVTDPRSEDGKGTRRPKEG